MHAKNEVDNNDKKPRVEWNTNGEDGHNVTEQ